jgi:DNA-binding NarL/FixJ family response regulator
VFESAGCFRIVGTAANEGEARPGWRDHPAHWDVAIVDLVLSGAQASASSLARKETHADGCVVVLSSFVSEPVEKHCLRLGRRCGVQTRRTTLNSSAGSSASRH